MSVDELIVRLKDRMVMHKTEFRNAFNQLDYKRKGKITRKDFRVVRIPGYLVCLRLGWTS